MFLAPAHGNRPYLASDQRTNGNLAGHNPGKAVFQNRWVKDRCAFSNSNFKIQDVEHAVSR